jgi:hypothetical protein
MRLRRAAVALPLAAFLTSLPAPAKIDITLDADSLNGLLTSMAPDHVEVNLAAGRSLTLYMKDLKVTGFDPAAGANGGLTTSLRLQVPDLGIDVPVQPHLTLELNDAGTGRRSPYLRFDKVVLNLPLTGSIDVASLLPPLSLVPDTSWLVNSARGKVRVKPRLVDAKTGAKNIRMSYELDVEAADGK